MIKINVVARIADDKNFFLDLVYLLYKLKEDKINTVQVLFIGEIQNYVIYENILRMCELLAVSSQISFTKKSVRLHELPADVQNGYFLHFCVGDFIGYSGIESIHNGFKNIFYNADRIIKSGTSHYTNVCGNIDELFNFVKRINNEQSIVNDEISRNSLDIVNEFSLSDTDKHQLLSILIPAKIALHK